MDRIPKKTCKDCVAEGITTKRKPAMTRAGNQVPGGRCVTHHRARRKSTSETSWERRLLATYGITADEYWAIYEFQGGRCYICQRASGKVKRLSVDHDHTTGFVRGLCCSPCNRDVLGHARDEIAFFERAIEYLTCPPATKVIGWRHVPSGGAPVRESTERPDGARRTTTDGGELAALSA